MRRSRSRSPLLRVARAGTWQLWNPVSAPSAAGRVLTTTDLGECEKRLLGAIVDPAHAATISTA